MFAKYLVVILRWSTIMTRFGVRLVKSGKRRFTIALILVRRCATLIAARLFSLLLNAHLHSYKEDKPNG